LAQQITSILSSWVLFNVPQETERLFIFKYDLFNLSVIFLVGSKKLVAHLENIHGTYG